MISGRQLRTLAALTFASLMTLGCSINEQLQGYLGSGAENVLNITVAPITEGSSGSLQLTLAKALTADVVINYSSSDDSADVGSDYSMVSGSVTISAGATSETIAITTLPDSVYEGTESFSVSFSVPSSLKLSGPTREITINDDEVKPTVQFVQPSQSIAEDVMLGLGTVDVALSGLCQYDVVVNYSAVIASSTADALGVDYTLASGSLTITGGQTIAQINLGINNDSIYESSEIVTLQLSSPNAYASLGAQVQHAVTITENEPQPTVQFSSASATASEAITSADVVIVLSGPAQAASTVQYSATGGAATGGGTDYTFTSGILTFAGGEISKTLTLSIVDDTDPESDETIILSLVSPTTAALGTQSSYTYTIEDDDSPGILWTGLAGDNLWSTAGNWLGGVVPTASDAVIFTTSVGGCAGANCNVTLDQAVSVDGITLAADFTGTITQGAQNIVSNGDWVQDGGTFVGGSGFINIEADFYLNGGSFTSTSGNLTVGFLMSPGPYPNGFIITGGTFVHNGGTVRFDWNDSDIGDKDATIDVATSATFNNLILGGGGDSRYDIASGDTLIVLGSLTFGAGTRMLGGTIDVHGDITQTGAAGGTTNVRLVGLGAQTVSAPATGSLPSLEIAKPSGTATLSGNISINTNLKYTSGTVSASGSTIKFKQVWSSNENSSIDFGAGVLDNVSIEKAYSSDVTIVGTLNLNGNLVINNASSGPNLINGGTIAVGGNVTLTAGGNGNAAITLNGAGTQTITHTAGTWPSGKITVDKSGGALELATDVTFGLTQDMDLLNGTINMNGNDLGVRDILVMNPGTVINTDCGALTYNVAGSTIGGTINAGTLTPNLSINDITVTEGQPMAFTVSLDAPYCGGDITVNFKIDSLTATKWRDYSAHPNTSFTITAGQSSYTTNYTTFDNDDPEPTETFHFILTSSNVGTIVDSTGVGTILDDDAVSKVWTGLAGDGKWSTPGNWTGSAIPTASDVAVFDNTCTNCNANIDMDITPKGIYLTSGYTGTLTQEAGRLVTVGVGQYKQYGGTFIGSDANITLNAFTEIRGGTFTSTSATLQSVWTFIVDPAATFNHNNGTILFYGDCGCDGAEGELRGTITVNNLSVTRHGGLWVTDDVTVLGRLTMDRASSNLAGAGYMRIRGDFYNENSGYHGYPFELGHFIFDGTGDQYISLTNGLLPPITVNKPSGKIIQLTNIVHNWHGLGIEILSGSWDMNGFNLDVIGNLRTSAGTHIYQGCGTLTASTYGSPYLGTVHAGGVATPNIYIADSPAQAEGNSGSKTFPFVVTLDNPKCGGDVSVRYDTADGFATAGSDYTAQANQYLTFTSGQTSKTINVTVSADTAVEGNETFNIVLTSAVNGVIQDSLATTTINNDDVSGNVWTGLAGDGKWSTNGNWFDNTKPVPGEIAYFVPGPGACVAAACDATIDEIVTVDGFQMLNGYAGTITHGNFALNVGVGDFTITGGSFVGGAGTLTIDDDFIMLAGSFTIPNVMNAGDDWTSTGGTVSAGASHVIFKSSNGASYEPGSTVFNDVSFYTFSTSSVLYITGTMYVNGDVTLISDAGSGSYAFRNGVVDIKGDVTFNDGGDCFATHTSKSKFRLSGSGVQNINGSALDGQLPHVEIASTGVVNLNGVLRVGGDWTYTSGTVNAGTSQVRFESNGNSVYKSDGMSFNDVSIMAVNSSTALTIDGTMSVLGDLSFVSDPGSGSYSLRTGTVNVMGDIIIDDNGDQLGTFFSPATIRLAGSGSQTIMTGTISDGALPSVEIASTGTVYLQDYIRISRAFTYTSGVVVAGTSFVDFYAANGSNISPGSMIFNNVKISSGYAGSTYSIIGDMNIGGDLTLGSDAGSGSYYLSGGRLVLNKNLEVQGSDILGGNTSIVFAGSGDQLISGAPSIWPSGAVTISKPSGRVIQGSAITLGASQDIVFAQPGIWDMAGYNLTVDQLNGTAAAGTIYKQCATLTKNTTAGAINEIGGTYGVTLNIADAADVTENNATPVSQDFVISLSTPNCVPTIFNYATSDGTAVAPGDFTAIGTTAVTVPAATSSYTLTVATQPDAINEGNEYYTVQLSGIMANVIAGDIIGQGIILDDDIGTINDIVISTLSVSNITADDFAAAIIYSGDTDNDSTVTLYWCNETDYPGCNPEPANGLSQGSIVMSRGGSIYTAAINNIPYPTEGGEVLNVRVVAADPDGASGGPLNTTVTLLPILDVQEMARMEGQNFDFIVTLNRASAQNVTFNWGTSGGTATAGGGYDYTGAGGVATITAGQTSVTLPAITTNDDATGESTETFNMILSSPTGAVLRTASSPGRIVDNDPGLAWPKGFNGEVYALAEQPDRKMILGGGFDHWDDTINAGMVVIDANGSEKLSFNPGAGFDTSPYREYVTQPDGKIIVAGRLTNYNGISVPKIARLNLDGTLDTAFNPGAGISVSNQYVNALALQPDGKILVGGSFLTFNGSSYSRIIRLLSNGSIDTTFVIGTGFNENVECFALQSDGKIYVGGDFTTYNTVARARIARLNVDGSLDTTFLPGTGFETVVETIKIQSDGKILAGGWFMNFNSVSQKNIVRLNANGSKDASFNIGTGFSPGGYESVIYDIEVQPDNKIILAGHFNSYNGFTSRRIIRVNSDGSYDSTFSVGTGFSPTANWENWVNDVSIEASGKLLVGGYFSSYNGFSKRNIMRLSSTGAVDTTFITGEDPDYEVYGFLPLATSDYMVIGGFYSYNGKVVNSIGRLNLDGSLDTTFNAGAGAVSAISGQPRVMDLDLQADGKLLVAGNFNVFNGASRSYFTRLNVDGSIDTTFSIGTGPDQMVSDVKYQTDGRILLTGSFLNYNGNPANRIIRLENSGSVDTSFIYGTGFNAYATEMALDPSGRIIVAGDFTTYNGNVANRLVRILSDGTWDTSFSVGSGFNSSTGNIKILDNGSLYVAGNFNNLNGTPANDLVRLNSDGTHDVTFDMGLGANMSVKGLDVQSDDRPIIVGQFSTINGVSQNMSARLNWDGSLDTTFAVGLGTSGNNIWQNDVLVRQSGAAAIGGRFTRYDGQAAWHYKEILPPDSVSVRALLISNILSTGFKTTVGYHGDYDEDATFTLKWCNQTDNAGCTPANDTPMTWVSGQTKFEVTISGLSTPNDPGDTLKLQIEVTDPDGVEGAPLSGTVTLLP